MSNPTPSHLTNTELTEELARLARAGRDTTVCLVTHLAEFEARDLHLAAGFPSLLALPTVASPPAALLPVAPLGRPALVRPLAPQRYEVRFTASAETCAKLKRAQDLLRHAVPSGDTAAIVDRALTLLVADLERRTARGHGPTTFPPRVFSVLAQAPGGREARRMPA